MHHILGLHVYIIILFCHRTVCLAATLTRSRVTQPLNYFDPTTFSLGGVGLTTNAHKCTAKLSHIGPLQPQMGYCCYHTPDVSIGFLQWRLYSPLMSAIFTETSGHPVRLRPVGTRQHQNPLYTTS